MGGIVHTHSPWVAKLGLGGKRDSQPNHPCRLYVGGIACLRCLTREEIEGAYERNTGLLIADYFKDKEYMAVPACLCKNHDPFAWGKDAVEAVRNGAVLEEVAKMAARCGLINPGVGGLRLRSYRLSTILESMG